MDSTTLLAEALDQGHDVEAVGFYYGSKHNPHENTAARSLASNYFKVPFILLDVAPVMSHLRSALTSLDQEVPEGHYEAENMRKTVVPGRNLIFLSLLAAHAESTGLDEVWLGIHAGDHHIYPDCRPEFFYPAKETVEASSDKKVTLRAPFLNMDKTKIIALGRKLGVPYSLTRTCYKDSVLACGRCGSCQERLTAFAANGIEDPLSYESRSLILG